GFAPIVVTTVATSRVVQDIAEKYGCKMLYTKVGAPYISEAMHEKKAVFGGEEVGGIVWPDISLAKDGFLAAARLAQAVCSTPLSVLVGKLPAYYNYKTKLEASQTQKAKALAFMSKLKAPGATLTSIDGVRIDFADKSWVIVRASGTENYLRIFAEGRTQKQADSIATQYVEKIRAAIA
ncbi:hypothetical protein FJZ26_05490, partial [Candidatus Parvarchaeota archaeon]|nr:hypothetical protein [Candidatus Parvarchaeota archaeon]